MLERLVVQCDAVTLVLARILSVKNLIAQQWATAADLTCDTGRSSASLS